MNYIIDGEQIDNENFSRASIYLDASFVLTYLDRTDVRRSEVARLLDLWSDYKEVTLGMSNHTVTEVINRIFQMLILGSLQVYHEKNHLINAIKNGYEKLNYNDKKRLLDLDSARYLYGLAKREEILKFYRKEINVSVTNLIKLAKQDDKRRKLLDVFYNEAINIFERFVHLMRTELGFIVDFLSSLEDPHYQVAKANMRIIQLDITDSFHLAIAQSNHYDFLVTLDDDFVHSFYSDSGSIPTRIIKIA